MAEETENQILLYDGVKILAEVGGSLGLFLGFSFLGVVLRATNWAADYFSAKINAIKPIKTPPLTFSVKDAS